MYDAAIIGSGPAGLSAAINVRQRGGTAVIIGTDLRDNPLWKAERIDNYLGMPGLTGAQMLEAFRAHAEAMGVDFMEQRVLNTMENGGSWMLSAGNEFVEAYSVILAGGIVRGKKYPGEEAYLGRGVSYCATCDGMLYRNKTVAVFLYGDADQKEADFLSGIGCHVLIYRSPKQVQILGEKTVQRIIVDGQEAEVSCVFILRPSIAPTELFPGLELDGSYIRVDRNMATNLPGLFAAGDCTGTPLQVAKAVGEGLIAGQRAQAWAVRQKKAPEQT